MNTHCLNTTFINKIKYLINNVVKNFPLLLLSLSIAFSPSFVIGYIGGEGASGGTRGIEIRVEDIILLILLVIAFLSFTSKSKQKIEKPPFFYLILLWLFFGLASTLLNIILENLPTIRPFFFLIKEIEFFIIYFFTFYSIKNIDQAKFILKVLIAATVLNVVWVMIQIITPFRYGYYYGPTLFAEPSNPFGSGAVFLTLSLFLLNLLIYYFMRVKNPIYKKIILAILLISPSVGIFASGSMAVASSYFFSLIFLNFLYLLKNKNARWIRLSATIPTVIIICLFSFLALSLKLNSVQRQLNIVKKLQYEFSLNSEGSRINIWKDATLSTLTSPRASLIGYGKSRFGESHNQFIRNFAETGIIGALIFFILVGSIIWKSFTYFLKEKTPLIVALSAGLLTTTIAMIFISITAESFIYAVKLSETYWLFAGITMAVSRLKPQVKVL